MVEIQYYYSIIFFGLIDESVIFFCWRLQTQEEQLNKPILKLHLLLKLTIEIIYTDKCAESDPKSDSSNIVSICHPPQAYSSEPQNIYLLHI